ncbi:MAG: carboxypeptidase regulatory-like domain-containing protein, partial [Mycobacterium sp.]|uniref:carboxypeptidase-like regulatory domain-containing protein n=1 Tax=Mycobacterium sp. TaxID=1785 RepID=UPI001EB37466
MRRGWVFRCWLLTAAAALSCALAPSLARATPVKRYGGPTRSLGTHGTPTIQTLRALAKVKTGASANPASTTAPTNVPNNGGPVMSNVTIYNIFWVPAGNPSPNESLINQFTEDVGGQLINLLSQYGVQNQLGYGGSWVDTKALPSGRSTYTPPGESARPILLESDIQGVIADAQNANPQWQPPSLSVLYMVYLPIGTELCSSSAGCTFTPNSYNLGGICAYHGAYVEDANPGAQVVYGAMPSDGDRMDSCGAGNTVTYGYNGSNGPNVDPATDSEISTASHEIFEALTDPEPIHNTAWNGGTNPTDPNFKRQGEIGDMCAYIYNRDGYSDGGDITINGDRYFVQYEWDNATSSCVLPGGAMQPSHFYTGCVANTLTATNEGSTGSVTLPFTADFFGTSYDSVYVNSNGTVSFGAPVDTYAPFSLTSSQTPIIAPFFANVDTTGLGPPVPSGLVTYGSTTYENEPAFCVDWRNVGYWQGMTDKLDSFQLLLVQRPDAGPGDFDIIFNYDRVQWDSGGPQVIATDRPAAAALGLDVAEIGYSNGIANSFELSGSGQEGAFLDYGVNALTLASDGSAQPGRYVLPVRQEQTVQTGSLTGAVSDSSSNPVAGALVQACAQSLLTQSCQLAITNAAGDYSFATLPLGGYSVTVSPPPGSTLEPVTQPVLLDIGTNTLDFTLPGPNPPPSGVTVNGVGTENGIPVINWGASASITYTGGCLFGTGTWTVNAENTHTGAEQTVNGPLTETPYGSGDYSGTIPPLYPMHGQGTLTMSISCPVPSQDQTLSFTIYIDPSGSVVDTNGNPIAGATVTLLRSDNPTGPFSPVPNGSALMSPANRRNPDLTHADGSFG